ncbi:MAG: putative S-methylcysteine transport system substrate-binding protein yxeN [Thermoanaerobaculia bacterium]|jgi:polar amino acid transport system substrate-binding protein|nr:putative S-methylcysteine transport system substrate-binding protein yxeN [Thermoanaerobaculia bacterium]
MRRARNFLILAIALAFISTARADEKVLRWGGDAEGGAPFVEADPNDPSNLKGFDVEVAELIAKGLGRRPEFVQVSFSDIDQSVQRGDFDIGMSGVEDTPARRRMFAATIPYFEFQEVLTVRAEDRGKFASLSALRGRRIGTLGGTIAYETLLEAQKTHGVICVSYDDDVHPYADLRAGRLDAVLLDNIIAARSMRRTPGLYTEPHPVATSHYIGVLATNNTALRDRVNDILRARMRDGALERIYRKWKIWDDYQPAFFARTLNADKAQKAVLVSAKKSAEGGGASQDLGIVLRYVPALLRASLITIVLSVAAMALAVFAGVLIASGRVYGSAPVRALLTTYVEIVRGTPVLLQLFVLYYGLSSVIRLPAFVAALLGLGLNYAAYESEIYRGALEAVSRGQLEAARTLGLTESQVLRLVRGPQAFRIALAPMTNDFVALLKDSSLVSVITVIELTKQTSIFAANIGSWVIPGILCAALYLVLSLPLSRLAGRLENRWKAASE